MLNAHLPTENRRSSVGVYQTPTRSSALIGRCALISRPDSTVGGKLTNHSYHFQLLPGYLQGRARLDLAAILASTGFNYFTHFRHFCFVVSIQPRLKGNVELNWPKLFHTFSYIITSFFLHKCIHSIIPHQYM